MLSAAARALAGAGLTICGGARPLPTHRVSNVNARNRIDMSGNSTGWSTVVTPGRSSGRARGR